MLFTHASSYPPVENLLKGPNNGNTKRAKPKENQLGILNLHILPENSAEDLGFGGESCWGYVSNYENTPETLPHLPPKGCCNFT